MANNKKTNPRGQKRPQDGRGKGLGNLRGLRSNKNTGVCKIGGGGKATGGGKGKGANRSK